VQATIPLDEFQISILAPPNPKSSIPSIQMFGFRCYLGARFIESAAISRVSDAQVMHGLYLMDAGNLVDSARWFSYAAYRKNSTGEFLYGKCLRDGIGVPRNLEAAAVYLKRSADRGNAEAQQAYVDLSNPGALLKTEQFIFQDPVADDAQNTHRSGGRMRLILILVSWAEY
jgi:TPR repeat protein